VNSFPPSEPLFALRPTFATRRMLPRQVALGLFFGAWGAVFFGGLTALLLDARGAELHPAWSFATFGLVFAAVVPALDWRRLRRDYAATVLAVFDDRLELATPAATRVLPREVIRAVDLGRVDARHDLAAVIVRTRPGTGGPLPLVLDDVPGPERAHARLAAWLAEADTSTPPRRAA